ncbi:hypothetical protein [Sphaerisporangium rhizosphaerae]|uniref:Roadblock/LC7 domain-containing protein n=1 Tax=Sphaerisporangium rhizosphaerae TaxID=2269375 RepID=A0ABW2P7F3_9ACTN
MLDIEDCLTDILAIPGALDALVIEDTGGTDSKAVAAGRTVADLDPQVSAAALRRTLRATLDGLALTSPDGTVRVEDVIITADTGHHLLRPLETALTGPILLYLRLDLERANLALARHRLRAISGRLVTQSPPGPSTPARSAPAPSRGSAAPAGPSPGSAAPAGSAFVLPKRAGHAGIRLDAVPSAATPPPGAPEAPGPPRVSGDPGDVGMLLRLRDALEKLP